MADEKDEKFDEKEMEKQEEKSTEEKSWDEKWRRDPLGSLVWAAIFIWAGLVLLANNLGYLDRLLTRFEDMPGWLQQFNPGVWGLIVLGAGVLLILEVVVRLLIPAYRRPITGTLILAVIFIGIGLGNLWNWNLLWPLILIILGVSVLMRGLRRR